jgi:hypothetical protein
MGEKAKIARRSRRGILRRMTASRAADELMSVEASCVIEFWAKIPGA